MSVGVMTVGVMTVKQSLAVSMNLKSLLSSLLFVLHVVQSGSSHYSDSHYSDTHNSDSHYSDSHYSDTH
jgi:hypothetical protein